MRIPSTIRLPFSAADVPFRQREMFALGEPEIAFARTLLDRRMRSPRSRT